jgi:SAM-dependent methyltransferase
VSREPSAWAAPLYAQVLERAEVGPGRTLLDLGCGAGELARMAVDKGAVVTGIDLDEAAVAAAAERVPEGSFTVGDAHEPPPGPFDAAVAVQLVAHVANPVALLKAAAAVAPLVVVTVWGRDAECDVRAFGEALAGWLPPKLPKPGPPSITEPDRLRQLVGLAGLVVASVDEVECAFDYPDEDELVGPVLVSGIGRHAINRAGPVAVRSALIDRLADNRRPDGSYRLVNRFRVVTATRPPAEADGPVDQTD